MPTTPLRDLYEAALAQPPAARAAWLDDHVPDPARRRRLDEMLRDDDAATDPLARSAGDRLADLDDTPADGVSAVQWRGRRIGAFVLREAIGEGGSSVVFRGEREPADFAQQVAVKVLRRGLFSPAEQHWFRRERRVLAQLEHPHIARLIDGGVSAEGLPYLVMEYVAGLPLTEHCRREALSLRQRLVLMVAVCRAVEAAHRAAIVHRDIKPSNILVTADGQPKLLDFGIAKLLEDDGDDATRTGMGALTPAYAAPEQFVGGPVTTATDVYALGVVLHELLIGQRPTTTQRLRPSTLAAHDDVPVSPATLRGDLDNIVLKALAVEPSLRYANAGALADDIERHLAGRPVLAHPPSRWYRARKFVQRHRGSVAVSLLLVAGIVAALVLALWQGHKAQQEARRADLVRDFLFSVFESAEDAMPRDSRPGIDDLARLAAQRLDADDSLDPATRAQLYAALARVGRASSAYDEALRALDRALADFAAAGDPRPRDRLVVAIERADVLARLGRLDEASAALAAVDGEIRAVDDRAAVIGVSAQAAIATRLSRFDEAVRLAEEATARARRVYGVDTSEALEVELMQGDVLCTAARMAACVALLTPALARWQALGYVRRLPYPYANSLQSLASAAFATGDVPASERYLREALALQRQVFRPPSETLATTLRSLSTALLQQDRHDEADAALRESEAMYRELFGEDHPQVAAVLDARGSLELGRRRMAAAAAHYERVTAICARAKLDATAPCGRAWQNLSFAYLELRRLDDADRANATGLAIRREHNGVAHPSYANSLSGRAAIRVEQDRPADALPLIDEALAVVTAAGLGDGEAAGVMHATRARVLAMLGRFDEALPELEASERILAETIATNATRRVRSRVLRSEVLAGLGRRAEARAAAAEAIASTSAREAVSPARWHRAEALARDDGNEAISASR